MPPRSPKCSEESMQTVCGRQDAGCPKNSADSCSTETPSLQQVCIVCSSMRTLPAPMGWLGLRKQTRDVAAQQRQNKQTCCSDLYGSHPHRQQLRRIETLGLDAHADAFRTGNQSDMKPLQMRCSASLQPLCSVVALTNSCAESAHGAHAFEGILSWCPCFKAITAKEHDIKRELVVNVLQRMTMSICWTASGKRCTIYTNRLTVKKLT